MAYWEISPHHNLDCDSAILPAETDEDHDAALKYAQDRLEEIWDRICGVIAYSQKKDISIEKATLQLKVEGRNNAVTIKFNHGKMPVDEGEGDEGEGDE